MRKAFASVAALVFALHAGTVPAVAAEISGEEASLYSRATSEKDPAAKVGLLEQYLQQFPEGAYQKQVRYFLTIACRQANQNDAAIQYGEQTLAADGENVDVLLVLAELYSAKSATWDKAVEYSDRAVAALTKKEGETPPSGTTTEQWKTSIAKMRDMAVFTRELVKGKRALGAKDFAAAEGPLNTAYGITKSSQLAFWIGIAYSKLGKTDDAILRLCEAVVMNGPTKEQAQKELEKLYQEKNKSLDGLDQAIEAARARVPTPH